MGRDVGATSKPNPKMVIKNCGYVLDEINRARCISGAAKDWFWEASGARPAVSVEEVEKFDPDKMKLELKKIQDRLQVLEEAKVRRRRDLIRIEKLYERGEN